MSLYKHTSGVFLPDEQDFQAVTKTADFIATNLHAIGRPRLFAALAIALCTEGGIPITNLRRYAAYYSLADFVFSGGVLFFVALLPQKNGGLGSIPLPLGPSGSILGRLVTAAHADYRLRRRRFVDEAIAAFPKILSAAGVDAKVFLRAVGRVSYYRCQYQFSGLVAAALSGRLLIPLNRVEERDIFTSLELGPPIGLDGQPWRSAHEGTETWNAERNCRARASLLGISGGAKRYVSGERGMGRPYPASLSSAPALWNANQWAEFSMLFNAPPTLNAIEEWLDLVGVAKEGSRSNRALALQVRLRLRRSGALRLDRPVRFVPMARIREFLELTIAELRKNHPGKRGEKLAVGVLLTAALGPRPRETHALRQRDVRMPGTLITARIRGVRKTVRARREAFANFPGNSPDREWLIDTLRAAFSRLQLTPTERICDYDSGSLRQFRDAVGQAIKAAALTLFGDDTGYNCYTLRHLCSWMLLENAFSIAFEKNFYDTIGTMSSSKGHSLPEFLGGYCGTGVIAVLAHAKLLPNLPTK